MDKPLYRFKTQEEMDLLVTFLTSDEFKGQNVSFILLSEDDSNWCSELECPTNPAVFIVDEVCDSTYQPDIIYSIPYAHIHMYNMRGAASFVCANLSYLILAVWLTRMK